MLTRFGDIEIWRILESVDPFLTPAQFFGDVGEDPAEVIRAHAPRQLCPQTGQMLLPIQGFLIRTPDHVVLVDACVGNDKTCEFHPAWHHRQGTRFLAGLSAAGVTPDDVDYVMCTHLHVDHVGWNTRLADGRWVPTFPNARYLFPEVDHAHFSAEAGVVYQESVLPVVSAGQADLVGADHKLGDHLAFVPTPGHTPGHVSVRVASNDARGLITGDALHSPVQCWRPDWNFSYDADKPVAAASRRRFLQLAVEEGATVLGSHFPLPSLGRVVDTAGAFAWEEV